MCLLRTPHREAIIHAVYSLRHIKNVFQYKEGKESKQEC